MAGAPAKDTSLHRRLTALERETVALRRLVERQTHRVDTAGWPRDVRIVRAVAHADDSPSYPLWPANTYRAECLDSHYSATPGQQSTVNNPRGEKIVIHDRFGGYLFEGDEVIVARIRGLGGFGDGEWWVIGGERTLFKGAATSAIAAGGSGTANLYNHDGTETVSVVVYFNHLEGTTAIASGKNIAVEWFRDEQKFIVLHAAC